MIIQQDVVSSAIEHVAYDTDTRILRITFTNGGTYDYPDVPEEEYHRLVTAQSVGVYYNKSIRPLYRNKKQWTNLTKLILISSGNGCY